MNVKEADLLKLSVLMPVYNEARTLRRIVERVLSAPIEGEIELLCVDDGSSDKSWEILVELQDSDNRVRIFRHENNRGKGAAIRTAIEAMTGDIALVQDSDLEYDPDDYPSLIKPITDGRADAVFGSRFAASPERRVLLFWHSLGNKALTGLTNALNDLNLTDMETGYKAVRSDILKNLRLESERFGIEPEITTRLAQWGARIYEIPISYHGRGYDEGKNIGWRDGVQAIWLLLKYRFLDTRYTNRTGHETLEGMAVYKSVSRWSLGPMRPHLGARVLEAGAGIGSLTRHLLGMDRLVALESDPFFVESLERRWGHLDNVSIIEGDLEDPALYEKLAHEGFDSVLCVNVLEHLGNPRLALEGFGRVLERDARLVVLVPAHQWLYSQVDVAIGHQRRFEADEIRTLLLGAGFEVLSVAQFNRLGALGWALNKWTGGRTIRKWQARLFALALPIARALERVERLPGLSLVVVARRL